MATRDEQLMVDPIEPTVGRLAPSPTGALHLGNARSFLLAWLTARQQQGHIVLRIEDIDSPRVKPWAVEATLHDLAWLGLDWDNASEVMVQSQRLDRYQQVLDELRRAGAVFPCTCTRSEVAEAASAPHESAARLLEGPLYPGTCRSRRDEQQLIAMQAEFAYRWRFADAQISWNDVLQGCQTANPKHQLGDFVIARSTGLPAYQLAVVVDDFDQGVNQVVRGDDLVASTYRQLAILNLLGWKPPTYIHVPLIIGPDGKRLAKRHGDTRLSRLRQLGVRAEAVVGYLAHSLRIIDRFEAITPSELIGMLAWRNIATQPTVFDLERELPQLLNPAAPRRFP